MLAGELEANTRQVLQRASVGEGPVGLQRVNDHLLRVGRAFTRPGGLSARPWFKNLFYAPSVGDLYAAERLPGVQYALRRDDDGALASELDDLASLIRVAAVELVAATVSLRAAADSRVAANLIPGQARAR